MLPAADRASPPPPPPAPPPAPTRAAREGGSTTYGASTGPNATPGQRLTAQTTPADRLAPAPRPDASPPAAPPAGRQLSDDDVRSAATRVVETGERRFWSDDHDARLDAFAREADGLDADSRRRLTAEVLRADSGAVNSWLQGSRLDDLAQDGRITPAERTAVVEGAAGAYVAGDLSYAQMHTFLGASTDRAPALDPEGFERARDLARGSSPEMSAMREKLVQDAFTQSAERARNGMGFATADAAWATSLAADAGESAMVGRSFAALDADAQRAVAGSIGEWSIGYRNSQGEIPGLADPLAVLTSGVRQVTPLNTAAGQLNMTRVAEGLVASRDVELQSAAGMAFREVATARDTQRRQDPQALSDGLARVADADARAAKALSSLPPNATPEQVWRVYQADPQAIVGSTFTQYLELRGDTARQLQGAALRNDIGLAMGLAPNRAPKDAVEQAAMDRGELDYFDGQELEAVRAIEAKVHDVGGPDARVAALPVTVASEKHGVIQVPLYRVEGADGRARFVDYDPATGEARTYRDFQDWRDNNKLPPGRMTYAANGHLTAGADGKPQTVTENTPKTPDTAWENWIKPTLDGAALVGSVVLIGAAVVGTGGTALVVGGGLLTAYYGAQGANELIDRGTHGQGVNPITSAGARGAWIDVGASAVGLAAAGASLRLAAAAGRTSSLDDLARLSSAAQQARVLNVGAAVADAGSAANTGYNLAAQWGSLTPQERVAGLAQLAFWSAGTAVSARQVYETKGLRLGIEADRARLEAPGNGPQAIALRQEANAALRNSPAFARDMQQVGVTPRQIELMSSGQLPLGFKDTAQFAQFKAEMDVAMRQAGLPDAEIGLKGTATTFYSENPGKPLGHHWDADPANPGDYDFNVTSPAMVETLRAAGIKPSETYGVYKTKDLERSFPALDAFQEKWSGILGRDVNFVGYPAAQARDATEYVVRTTP